MRDPELVAEERSPDVGAYDPVETVDIEGVNLAEDGMAAPGIVVQYAELAEAANYSVRHRFDAGGVAYIAGEELGVASLRANCLGGSPAGRFVAIDDRDLRALAREKMGSGVAPHLRR
jgi:hypothetical protein